MGGAVGGHGSQPTWASFQPQVVRLRETDVMDQASSGAHNGARMEALAGDALLDAHELTQIAGSDGVVQERELYNAGFVQPEDRQAILRAIGTNTARTGFNPIGMRFDNLDRNIHAIETASMVNPVVGASMAAATHSFTGAGSVGDFAEMEARKVAHLMGNVAHLLTSVHSAEDLHHALDTLVKDTMAAFGKDSVVAGLMVGAFEKLTHTVNVAIEGMKHDGHFDTGRIIGMAALTATIVAVQAVPGVNVAVDAVMTLVAGADAGRELMEAGSALMDQISGGGNGFRTGAEVGQALVGVAMTALAYTGTTHAVHNTRKMLQGGADVAHVMTHAMAHTGRNGAELTHIAEQMAKLLSIGH